MSSPDGSFLGSISFSSAVSWLQEINSQLDLLDKRGNFLVGYRFFLLDHSKGRVDSLRGGGNQRPGAAREVSVCLLESVPLQTCVLSMV